VQNLHYLQRHLHQVLLQHHPASHVRENAESERRKSKKTSNSFEFTSFWADGNNRAIPELADFT
jgi:hypothetical protein